MLLGEAKYVGIDAVDHNISHFRFKLISYKIKLIPHVQSIM